MVKPESAAKHNQKMTYYLLVNSAAVVRRFFYRYVLFDPSAEIYLFDKFGDDGRDAAVWGDCFGSEFDPYLINFAVWVSLFLIIFFVLLVFIANCSKTRSIFIYLQLLFQTLICSNAKSGFNRDGFQ